MKIIVGLGNPGKEYENSRHNAGWLVLDELIKDLSKTDEHFMSSTFDIGSQARIHQGVISKEKILLLKPQTFMNNSGDAVHKIKTFYKVQPEDIFCIYDDLDTPFGSIRIRGKGGPGTHNGMKSVVQKIGENFPRLRLGIESRGTTSPKEHETTSFVLGKFNKEEAPTFKKIVKKAVKAVKAWITDGIETAMNTYNS